MQAGVFDLVMLIIVVVFHVVLSGGPKPPVDLGCNGGDDFDVEVCVGQELGVLLIGKGAIFGRHAAPCAVWQAGAGAFGGVLFAGREASLGANKAIGVCPCGTPCNGVTTGALAGDAGTVCEGGGVLVHLAVLSAFWRDAKHNFVGMVVF